MAEGRVISYTDAIREATEQAMSADEKVLLLGMGVDDHKAIHGSTRGLKDKFPGRVFDTPLSEDGMQGVCNGLAMAGWRPIHVYTRFDFALLAMNQLVNMAAKARYMYGGRVKVPVVVRVAIGRSWGQGAQHSQGLHGVFAHVPGLKVVVPSTPTLAKGLLLEALRQEDPVIYVEHRLLYGVKEDVPENVYRVPFGRAVTHGSVAGSEIVIVATSAMVREALEAKRLLYNDGKGVAATVVDPVTVSPLDRDGIAALARESGRLLVVDNGWPAFGTAAEICASVAEREPETVVARMGYAEAPCPTAKSLENLYYPDAEAIAARAWKMVTGREWVPLPKKEKPVEFRGPF